MNVMRSDRFEQPDTGVTVDSGEPRREVMRLARLLRRNWIVIFVAALAAVVLGLLFVAVAEQSYRSTVRILLDQNRTGDLSDAANLSEGTNVDEYIATQVALVQSDVVIRRVAEHLRLDEAGDLQLIVASPNAPAGSAAVRTEAEERPILEALRRMVSVYRLDRSFVMEVAATSPDAALSRVIADAVGSAYIDDQTESYSLSLTQAGNWLEERIDDLRLQSLEAAEAVERFRAESGIRATDGQLISDQQLTGLSNQSVLAEANAARLQSRYDVYNAAIEGGDIVTLTGLLSAAEAGEPGALESAGPDYLAAVERERAVVAAFGEDNAQLPAIRAEIGRLSRLVLVEARGRLAAYENELAAARAQLTGLEESMLSAATRSQTSNLPLAQLQSLGQRANSLQTLYQTYLTRYQETLQRQSLPLNGARKISDAEEASRPVFPNPKIVLAFALILGLGIGAVVSLGREFLDNSIRTSEQLKRVGLETVGLAPLMRNPSRPGRRAHRQMDRLRRVLLSTVRLNPGSKPRVVAFVSSAPGEGRSFMVRTFADAFLAAGFKVAVADLSDGETATGSGWKWRGWRFWRSPPNAPSPSPSASYPVIKGSFSDLQRILPGLADGPMPETLATSDLVLIDLPALNFAAELRAVAEVADLIFVVVRWGRTDADALREMLASGTMFQGKVAGAMLTMVDLRKQRRYEARLPSVDG